MVTLIEQKSIREFFEERFDEVLSKNMVELHGLTRCYILGLLTDFSLSHVAFSMEREDPEMPLSVRFLKATGKATREKLKDYKMIGDFSLFISGFFSEFIQDKIADMEFYIAIGSNAYSNIESSLRTISAFKEDSFIRMYRELAEKFPDLVDLCIDMSERMRGETNRNIMRIYERYIQFGAKRYEKALKEAGIPDPQPAFFKH